MTILATGRSMVCAPETLEKSKAALYSYTLYQYLHHRMCVYTRVHMTARAAQISRAMEYVSAHRYDLDTLQQAVRRNRAFLQSIAPKTTNKWTTILPQILI